MDAAQGQTEIDSFAALKTAADGLGNYLRNGQSVKAEALLLDEAQRLTLTAPQMTVLIGGPEGSECELRAKLARDIHGPAGRPQQRFLREPARHAHRMEAGIRFAGRIRGARPVHRKVALDSDSS